jgi:hypothetical protein
MSNNETLELKMDHDLLVNLFAVCAEHGYIDDPYWGKVFKDENLRKRVHMTIIYDNEDK